VPGCGRIWETRWWGADVPLGTTADPPGNQRQIPLEIKRRSPGNKQTNQPQIPGGNQMQIPKTSTIKWHQLELIFFLEVQDDRIDNSESNALLRI